MRLNKLKLIKYPNKLLDKVTEPVDINTDFINWTKAAESFCDMISNEYKQVNLAGMASPQMGSSINTFVLSRSTLPDSSTKYTWFVNPEIVWTPKGPKDRKFEGCYSLDPTKMDYPTMRYYSITIKYQNLDGDWIQKRFNGYQAWVIQHEMDHLKGICVNHPIHKL